MIHIGLTGWGDHDSLYEGGVNAKEKLKVYSSHFPVVEVDSSFYAIQPNKNYERWVNDTPDRFCFVIKAYQGLTKHSRPKQREEDPVAMVEAFKASIQPVIAANKLKAVLFQFPPWYDCQKKHVNWLRFMKEQMETIPVALEFRHRSWFTKEMTPKTLQFMRQEGWIHSIVDEPQAGDGSIPTVLETTNESLTIVRFHGRNVHGWNNRGQDNWREVRYLYNYSVEELEEWKAHILKLQKQSKDVIVLFNNNSGGDAAANAKHLINLLHIDYDGLSPRQLSLF